MWISRVGVALVTAAAMSGCNDLSGPNPGERHGKDIGQATGWAKIRWTPSGDQVTFVSADARTAFAHRLASGVTRTLFTVNDDEDIYDVQFSSDAKEFFTSSRKQILGKPISTILRRHTASTADVLEDVVGVLVARGHAATAFRVSSESLYVVQRGEEPSLIGSRCTDLIAWSPDDTSILCATGFHTTYGIFHINGASMESFTLPAGAANSVMAFHWDARGIKVSHSTECFCQLSVYDEGSGLFRALLPPDDGGAEGPPHQISWSNDGTRAAYWTHFCHSDNAVSCRIERDYFYILDLPSGTPKRVAVHACHYEGPVAPNCNDAQVAISPTGSKIAYTINSRLFLLDVK